MIDAKVDQEIRVQNAEASYVQSKENLEVTKNQAAADVDKAQLALRFAKEDLVKYQEGDYPNKRKDLLGRIALAEEDVKRTEQKLEWSENLFAEKYLSETEVEADRLAAKKAKLDLELARSNLTLLDDYTYRRQIDQLTSDVRQAEMALERVTRKAAADLVQAEAQLLAREAEFTRNKDKLEKLKEQIAKARIVAPTAGTVVYATSAQFNWRGNVEPLDEGQEVRERQELIYLPTADTFLAEVNIHEASLKKIYVGLPVRLKVDALPGHSFTGKVSRIAPLPDARSMFMNPDLKVYKTEIHIDGGGDVLRTGMTCQVEIVVEQHDDALYVPVQSVVRINGKPTVFVKEGEATLPRTVEIGLDNNLMVHVLGGLKEGEQVLLAPPFGMGAEQENAEEQPKLDIPDRPAAQARPNGEGNSPETGNGTNGAPGPNAEAPPAGAGERARPTPEEIKQMRERFEKMTPEEQEKARQEMRARRGGQGGGGGRPPREGGAPRGGAQE
jgi:HlyD family secretion protein